MSGGVLLILVIILGVAVGSLLLIRFFEKPKSSIKAFIVNIGRTKSCLV